MSLFPELDTIEQDTKKRKPDDTVPDSGDLFPELKGTEAAPPPPQTTDLSKKPSVVTPPVPTPNAQPTGKPDSVTDEGALSKRDTSYLDSIRSMVRTALPAPLQPVVDIAANAMTPDKHDPNAPLFPEAEQKQERDAAANMVAPALDPITGLMMKTDPGKRAMASVISGALGTAAGTVASIPAAEAHFGKDTWIGQTALKTADWLKKAAAETMPENPDFVDQLASGAGSMALFMAPGTGAARVVSQLPRMGKMAMMVAPAIGAGVSAVLESATEAGTVYQDQIAKGVSRDIAAKSAFRDFWQNVILVGVTNKLGIFGEKLGPIKKALTSASMEGIQEGAQSIISSLAKNEPIDWKGDVLPSAGIGALLGAGAGPIVENLMEPEAQHETTITDKTLGTNGSSYLKSKFPQLYEQINNQTVPMSEDTVRELLIHGAAAGEEVILKGGTPEQANQAAIEAFSQAAKPHVDAHAAAQTSKPFEAIAPRAKPAIAEMLPAFDPEKKPELAAKEPDWLPTKQELENDAIEPAPQEGDSVIPLPDKPVRIKKADIEAEAQYLHQRATEEREGKVSPLEQFVKENGGIASYTKDANGNTTEAEEYKNIPVRLRGTTAYDEMSDMARKAGVLDHDAPYSALYDTLNQLEVRGNVPRVEDFYDEARRTLEHDKLQERAAKQGDVPPETLSNYSAARYPDLQIRAKSAAERVLQSNKIDDRVLIDLVDAIKVDPVAFQKGYGKNANPADFEFKGETRNVTDDDKVQAVINLAKGATEQTGRHEAFHAVSNILLDEAEQGIITKKYGDMEKAADAFGEYRTGKETDDSLVNKAFSKIKEFLEKIGNYLETSKFTTAKQLFDDIEHGRFADRAAREQARQEYSATPKTARFIGYMEGIPADEHGPAIEPVALYNVPNAQGLEDAWGADKLRDEGITVPVTPPFEEWQRNQHETQYSALQKIRQLFSPAEHVKREQSSPEFFNWFGDSKIVDKNGEPRVVYHGTEANFGAFDPARRELGFHFGADAEQANSRLSMRDPAADIFSTAEFGRGASIMPVYLRMENPIHARFDAGQWNSVNDVMDALPAGTFTEEERKEIWNEGHTKISRLRELLQEKGFDGIVYPNQYETRKGQPAGEAYIVFDPQQIKSANNLGSFDPNNMDIRYSAKPKNDPNQYDLFNEKGEATLEAIARDPKVPPVEKVAEPLNVPKQTNKTAKEMEDVGEQLWYNRRNFTGKGHDWESVKDLNPALKVREVTKPKVWAKPDYEALVRDGMNPFTAHLIKQVYDSIGVKPGVRGTVTDENMKSYIEAVGKVREAVFEWAKAREPMAGDIEKRVQANIKDRNFGGMTEVARLGGSLIDKIFPQKEGQESHRRFYANPEYNEMALLLGGRRFVDSLQPSYNETKSALKALSEGWPSPQEAWARQFGVRSEPAGTKVYDDGQSRILEQPEYFVYRKATRRIMKSGFKTQAEAEAFGRSLVEKKRAGLIRLEPVSEWERTGPPRRMEGENVNPEKLMNDYGFRGVNYGNWVNQEERQDFTNQAYDALADLADVLHVPPKSLSLNGLLGLAFGAQGRGGTAAAHFVPGVNEINLTKTAGAGALAHEWGHALDHYFAVKAGEKVEKSKEPFLTSHAAYLDDKTGSLRPEIRKAFSDIVSSMKKRTETPEETKQRVALQDQLSETRLTNWLKGIRERLERASKADTKEAALKAYDKVVERIRNSDFGDGRVQLGLGQYNSTTPVVADIREIFRQASGNKLSMDETKGLSSNVDHIKSLRSAENQAKRHAPQTTNSKYLNTAMSMDKDKGGRAYWSQPTELFARAFESYVMDRLDQQAGRNDYLVRPQSQSTDSKTYGWYPRGAERETINHAFNALVDEIKTKEGPKGPAMYSAEEKPKGLPGGNEIVPRYEAQPKPDDEFYLANRKMQQTAMQGMMHDAKVTLQEVKKSIDKVAGTLSTRLGNIDPSLKRAIRRFEHRLATRTMEDMKAVEPFLRKFAKLEKVDQLDLDLALKNRDTARINNIVNRNNMGVEYYQFRKVDNDLFQRAKEVKFDLRYLADHFPRKIKDAAGFLDYVGKRDDWSIIAEAIQAKETALGRYLTLDEKAEVVNSMIQGTRRGLISLSETGNMKDRMIPVVEPGMNRFYYSSPAALVRYVNEMNNAIEARRFFGKGTGSKTGFDYGDTIENVDVDNSIGGYIIDLLNRNVIKPSQEKELRDMLAARFAPTGPGSIVGLFRNLSYIDAMGSPISALTQIGDLGFSLYRGGAWRTTKNFTKALFNSSDVNRHDIGVDKIAQEFADPTRSYKALEKVFKMIGLDKLDMLGKETYINTILDKYRAQLNNHKNTADVFERLNKIFGPETPQAIADIQSGKMSENVKYLLFSELCDIQPISLSEVPEKYLSGGNGRIFYMLKTFTIKQLDLFRGEVFQKMAQPGVANKIEGVRRLIYLGACLAMANAGSDMLKNFFLNRPTNPPDVVVDNLFRLFGFSKFNVYDARRHGLGEAAINLVVPPHKLINSLYKDFLNVDFDKEGWNQLQGNFWTGKGLESTSSIPFVGKIYYWWFGKGVELSAKTQKKMDKKARLAR